MIIPFNDELGTATSTLRPGVHKLDERLEREGSPVRQHTVACSLPAVLRQLNWIKMSAPSGRLYTLVHWEGDVGALQATRRAQ